jgi:hypothetical protein
MSYHDEYKRMLIYPGAFTDKMSSDEVLNTLQRFHVLRPIISKNDQDTSSLANFLGVLHHGIEPSRCLWAISFKWEPLVSFSAIALSICRTHGASMHVLLPWTVEWYPRTHQQCSQSQVTQIKGKGEKENQARRSIRHWRLVINEGEMEKAAN